MSRTAQEERDESTPSTLTLLRHWLHNPQSITLAAFGLAGLLWALCVVRFARSSPQRARFARSDGLPVHPFWRRGGHVRRKSTGRADLSADHNQALFVRFYRNAPTQATRRLELVVTARRDAVDLRTLLSNQLNSALKTYFPQALDLFGDEIYTPLPLDFLTRWPSLTLAQAARPAALRQFYHTHNSRRPALIEERLAVLHTTRPLTTNDAVIEVGILHTRMLVAQLRPRQKAIESFEERIAEAFAAHPDRALFCSLPAAGPTLAPRLLVAFGSNRARYPSASSLQKYAGVAPVREKSGRQMWTHWRWNCPKFLRQSYVEWAGCTIPRVAWAKTYYRRQEARGVGHHAIPRGLAFKWIRILWRCWQDRAPYDENRYIEALTRHHSPEFGPCLFS